jgi:DNA-directed RNA polymerase alpha subunit
MRLANGPETGHRVGHMEQARADLELAVLHLKQLEIRLAEQRSRIAQLREAGAATATAEEFLSVLQQNVELVKVHIARISKNEVVEKSSRRDDSFSIPVRDKG